MEITFDNQMFIVTALEAHIKSLKEECGALNNDLVSEAINERIAAITPILDALNSGDYYLEMLEV